MTLDTLSNNYLVGYPQKSFGYLLYNASKNKVFVSQRGLCHERGLVSKEVGETPVDLEEISELNEEPAVETSTQLKVEQPIKQTGIIPTLPPRRSNRVFLPPKFYGIQL